MTRKQLAATIDHTFLKAAGDSDAVRSLCQEAVEFGFHAVMINPAEVKMAAKLLRGSDVQVGTVIGFPLGQNTVTIKRLEALEAIKNGANELDFVMNQRLLRGSGGLRAVKAEFDELVSSVKETDSSIVTKIILETCNLTQEEKIAACLLAKEAGFDFVKTSTGFGTGGATVDDVRLMRETVGPDMGVKAAGGIRDYATAMAMLEAGATRLGCSAGVAILSEVK